MRHLVFALLATAALWSAPAPAQSPSSERPIRFIVAFAPGSAPDMMARSYAEKLKELMRQNVIVEPRPGATGAIGADLAAKSAPDGNTIVLLSSAVVISPWFGKQPFDLFKDLAPVVRTAQTPYVLAVNNKVPVNNFSEFIDYARKNPDKLSCSTYGVGSPPHLALEMLKKAAGVQIRHIPYKTFAQALPDLSSGQLDCSFDVPTTTMPQVRNGRLRVIAHTGAEVIDAAPEAEPFGRQYPQAVVVGWQSVFAPAGTPPAALARLRTEWARVIQSPEVSRMIREAGFQPAADPIDNFIRDIQSDYQRFGQIIRENQIKPD